MDDCVLIHHDKNHLKYCMEQMRKYLNVELGLSFNEKTQTFPLKNGTDYLGWHFYLSDTGKVIRRLRRPVKQKIKKKPMKMKNDYSEG